MATVPSRADRITALADQCVMCGLCQPHCPTYALDRTEAESPRGRIVLMQAVAQSRLDDDAGALAHLDHCLACRACERVCPAHVRYGALLDLARAATRARRAPPWRQRVLEWLLRTRGRMDVALAMARLVRAWSGTLRRMSGPLPRAVRFAPLSPALAPQRGRVALFIGCLGRHFDAAAVTAATHVLQRIGFDVVVPATQQCCGALHRHAGAGKAADALVAANRAAFDLPAQTPVLTLASGCHEQVADALDVTGSAPRVLSLLAFLANDAVFATLPLRARNERIALQLPCTQRNVVRDAGSTAPLLARIPGLLVESLPDRGCCGAAGSHMLHAPDRAAALRAPLLDALAASGAATLCSSNIGCRMFLDAGARERGLAVACRHPVELLSEQLE